jgi:membrane protease YdiL (CAAX protease family)
MLNPFFGSAAPAFDQGPPLADLVPTFLVILLLIGIGEEPAWRGFALPGLARKRTILSAALLLGILHTVWHVPLFGLDFTRENVVPWMLMLMAFSVITAWLYTRTRGNLLLPALLHASVNVSSKYLFLPIFSGADQVQMYWISAALWWVAALVPLARLSSDAQYEGRALTALVS